MWKFILILVHSNIAEAAVGFNSFGQSNGDSINPVTSQFSSVENSNLTWFSPAAIEDFTAKSIIKTETELDSEILNSSIFLFEASQIPEINNLNNLSNRVSVAKRQLTLFPIIDSKIESLLRARSNSSKSKPSQGKSLERINIKIDDPQYVFAINNSKERIERKLSKMKVETEALIKANISGFTKEIEQTYNSELHNLFRKIRPKTNLRFQSGDIFQFPEIHSISSGLKDICCKDIYDGGILALIKARISELSSKASIVLSKESRGYRISGFNHLAKMFKADSLETVRRILGSKASGISNRRRLIDQFKQNISSTFKRVILIERIEEPFVNKFRIVNISFVLKDAIEDVFKYIGDKNDRLVLDYTTLYIKGVKEYLNRLISTDYESGMGSLKCNIL